MAEEYMIRCWFCTCEYDANEALFCSHTDASLICPFCLKCWCEAPKGHKDEFMKSCPKKVLEEKLILESRTSMKLGEILIRAGKITRSHLLSAIDKQKSFKKRIGQIFIMMDLITPEELSLYLMEQKWIDRIDLENFKIDFDLVETIGKNFCLAQKIIPIETYELSNKKILRLVLSSRDDLVKLKMSTQLKDFILIPYEGAPEDIDRLLKKIERYDVMVLK